MSQMSDSFNNENEIDIPEDVLAAASEEEATLLPERSQNAYRVDKEITWSPGGDESVTLATKKLNKTTIV